MKDWQRRAVVAIALALCGAAAYLPVVSAGWVWDDMNLVAPSPALEDLDGLRRAVATDLYRQAAPRLEASPYWRPLALASYWLDTRVGDAPRALHVGNLLLHGLATGLLAVVLLRRRSDGASLLGPALAAAWWSFHPENVETVAWISCRYELLCGVALVALLALPWRAGIGRAALHGLLFLAGLLSKDGFGAMLIAVVAMDRADGRRPAAAAPRWAAVGCAIAAWWAARAALGLPGFELPPLHVLPVVFLDAVRIYFARAIVAPPLTIGHPYASGGVLGIAIGGAVVVALVAAAVRRRRLALPVAVFLAGLIPAAVAIAKFGQVPERYFYLPSIGLALLAGDLLAASLAAKRALARWGAPVVVGLATLGGLIRLEARLPDWQSDDAIFAAALRVNPDDADANLSRAIAAGRRGSWIEARDALAIAQRADPRSGRIATALAWALLQSGDVVGAIGQAERATMLPPYPPDAWYYLALAHHQIGDHAGELAAIEQLLRRSPDYPRARGSRAYAACEVSGGSRCVEAAQQAESAR
ncbi:MAG TPA: tetratricopeptide repeat protein [Kofleriaceae bacterium]|nr:tetratricopeptide repeat protein [Kofleriaceae bacterium]